MTDLIDRIIHTYCYSHIRKTIFLCFPAFYILAAVGVFFIFFLPISSAVLVWWIINGILNNQWISGNFELFFFGPISVFLGLLGFLHIEMFSGSSLYSPNSEIM